MHKKTKKILVWGAAAAFLILVGASFFVPEENQPTGDVAIFAQCLKDTGAVFYGAFWCSHCQSQKTLFGDSQKLLPYVECATPDGNGQVQACADNKIEGYPTWIFADGTRQSGELSFDALSKKTGCILPQ